MNIGTIIYDTLDASVIQLNPYETAQRLHTKLKFTTQETENCELLIKNTASCKYAAIKVKVDLYENDIIDLGFGKFKSKDLYRNLRGCNEAFIFAATLGAEIDRLLKRLSIISPGRLFISDAIASSLAEAVCDEAERIIKNSLNCKPRFSPGYGDLSLTVQPEILKILNAQKILGITINEKLFMTPSKTITAIMGIQNETRHIETD